MAKDDALIFERYIRSGVSYLKESDLDKVLMWLGELDPMDVLPRPTIQDFLDPSRDATTKPTRVTDYEAPNKIYNPDDPNRPEPPAFGYSSFDPDDQVFIHRDGFDSSNEDDPEFPDETKESKPKIIPSGVTPWMQGIPKIKCMIIDGYDSNVDMLLAANAVDTLKPEQLMWLALANHNGTPLDELPGFVAEFDDDSEPGYFNVPDAKLAPVCDTFDQAIKYFKKYPKDLKVPPWLEERMSNIDWRDICIKAKRGRHVKRKKE